MDYGRNANGDVASAAVTRPGQSQQDLVSGVDWHPFGPPAAIEWANERLQLRELDAAGRPVQVTDGEPDGLTVDFGFSSVSNLTSITEPAGAAPADVTLTYDSLVGRPSTSDRSRTGRAQLRQQELLFLPPDVARRAGDAQTP